MEGEREDVKGDEEAEVWEEGVEERGKVEEANEEKDEEEGENENL